MRKHGFSMIELVIGMMIGAIVILMVGSMSQLAIASYTRMRTESMRYDNLFYAMDVIQNTIRRSTGNVLPAPPALATNFTFTNPAPGGGNITYVFSVSALGNLSFTDSLSLTTRTLLPSVTGFTITPTDNYYVVSITTALSGVVTTYTANAMRRN